MIRVPFLLAAAVLCSAAQNLSTGAPGNDQDTQATYTGPLRTLTLDEALRLAEQHSPQLQAGRADIDAARAGIVTAKSFPNPNADVLEGYQYQRLPDAVPGRIEHYGFSQPLDVPTRRSARLGVARLIQTRNQFALEDIRLRVRSAVKQAFYDVLRQKSELDLSKENLTLVEEFRRRINVKVEVGEAGRLELTRADAELATARAGVRGANLRYLTAIAALRATLGTPMSENITAAGQLNERVTLQPLEALEKQVLAAHPLLKEADVDVQRARAELKNERAQRIPEPVVQGYYERQPDLGFFELGVSVPIPIWNRRQGQIAEAQAGITRSSAGRDYQRLQLITELESAYGAYQVANEQVASFQSGALKEAQAALTAAEAAYKAGERGIIEVLDAQRVLRSVRLDYLNAQYDREAALIDLERLRAVEVK